jgi:hypothetical protein
MDQGIDSSTKIVFEEQLQTERRMTQRSQS